MSLNVLVWNEYHHEKTDDKVKEIYPNGIQRKMWSYKERHPPRKVSVLYFTEIIDRQ